MYQALSMRLKDGEFGLMYQALSMRLKDGGFGLMTEDSG
jgi:hypothetical protein